MYKRITINRRAVSPLIATVLLIAFAVALGAVVMNWGRTFTEQKTAEVTATSDVATGCSLGISLKILEIANKPQICVGEWGANSYINFTVSNEGSKKIDSLRIMIIGDSSTPTINNSVSNSSISEGGLIKLSSPYVQSNVGTLKIVRVIPVIDTGGKKIPCTGSVLEKESSQIPACNATS